MCARYVVKAQMNIVGYVDRFVPKLVADKLYKDAIEGRQLPENILTMAALFVNKRYDVQYRTAIVNATGRTSDEGLSHHLVLSPSQRRSHGRLVVMLAAQPMADIGVDPSSSVVLTFIV